MIPENKHPVFVYGSLKSGHINNDILKRSTLIDSDAVTEHATYSMRSLTAYPAVVEKGNHRIHGEVYLVNDRTLEFLDRFEGNGTIYERKLVPIAGHGLCWMYIFIHRDARFTMNDEALRVNQDIAAWQCLFRTL